MPPLSPQGTLLGYGATPTTIVGRVELEGNEIERASVETTDLDTTTGKTFRPSALYDGGELSGKVNLDPANATHQHLQTQLTNQTLETWTVTYSDTSKHSFSGFLTKLKTFESVEPGDEANVQMSFTIKVSGAVTFTPHS